MGSVLSFFLGGDAAAAAGEDPSSGDHSGVTAFHSSARWQLHFNSSRESPQLDPDLPSDMRESNLAKLAKLPRNISFTRIRNRCIFSDRPRGVYELFRMSRIVFRSLASKGMLNGIKKASW